MMDERRVADYFVVAGLPDELQPVDEFSKDGTYLKPTHNKAPITDITVIFKSQDETVPPGYEIIEHTPTGVSANLNHGSLRSPEVYLCYRRGRDKPPLVDIGVMYEGKERILPDSEVVEYTPGNRVANVNNSAAKTLLTYRRAPPTMPCNGLVVTDIVVIITSKQETPPHAFCMINKNLNKGIVGSDVFLCYKKSMNRVNLITYKPDILLRYPFQDRPNFPFPVSVPLFCLPVGATLECWPAAAQEPSAVFSTFVLTVSDAAEKVYGSAVTFYERYPLEKVTDEQRSELDPVGDGGDVTYHVNKCICLLSHWPFFDTFERFLLFLYKMSTTSPHPVPIERYVSHLVDEIPFPSVQRPRILLQLSPESRLILTQPEDLPLPRSGAGFRQLLLNLGPDNCLLLLLCALTEQKLLVHSLRPDVLTAVAEAVSMIIFPFKWQCPYIPLCPLGLAEVLHAPLPFLIGVDSRFFDLYDPPMDVNCVDLDTNNITVCDEKHQLNMKLLPKKAARALRNTLERIFQKLALLMEKQSPNDKAVDTSIDHDFQLKRREQSLELEIQEAFLRFMATILKGYRSYLLPIIKAPTVGTTDTQSLFDLQSFIRSRDRAYHKFFTLMMRTQMFIRFIEERSFVSDMDAGLAFFDECTEKVENDDVDSHLLELDESHQSERTVFIVPPEPSGNSQSYVYRSFVLDPLLLGGGAGGQRKETGAAMKGTLRAARLSGSGALVPGSPMARRTKHEIKSAQKMARKHATSPDLWAKCLLTTCYSIWFIHLPSCILFNPVKAPTTLRTAYDILMRIHKTGLTPADEVCYRVMMQLCGVYSQPGLAVKLLFQMKRSGVQPNAITYGFYNRAVLEATWPSDMTNPSRLLWNKLRNVVLGAALFRQAGTRMASRRRLSTTTEDGSLSLAADASADVISISSANSHESSHKANYGSTTLGQESRAHSTNLINSMDFSVQKFDRFRSRVGSIVRPTGFPLLSPGAAVKQQTFESSAGLLMPGVGAAVLLEEGVGMGELLLDLDRSDAQSPTAGAGTLAGAGGGQHRRQRRHRSGSCTEFTTAGGAAGLGGGGGGGGVLMVSGGSSGAAGAQQSGHHLHGRQPAAIGHGHTHRTSLHTPTSPKPAARDADCFKLLTRSESFANDAGILAKLNMLKLEMGPPLPELANGSSAGTSTGGDHGQGGSARGPAAAGRSGSSTCSKSLFPRRGSLNLQRVNEQPDSCASSTENVVFSGSGGGDSLAGSCDDLDKSLLPMTQMVVTPSRKIKTLPNMGSKNGRRMVGNDLTWSKRRSSVTGDKSGVANRSSSESLNKSPIKSPSRTPVTENDPLGALLSGDGGGSSSAVPAEAGSAGRSSSGNNAKRRSGSVGRSSEGRRKNRERVSNIEYDSLGAPVLFDRRKGEWSSSSGGGGRVVRRSATFHHNHNDEDEDDSDENGVYYEDGDGLLDDDELDVDEALTTEARRSLLQRSSTMPIDGGDSMSSTPANSVPRGSLGSTGGGSGSGFKLPSFTRYSPGRFSLRKPDLLNSQLIENAFNNFSSSSLASKKSNEILKGGLHSLKSAASSAMEKFHEIKEAISSNSTPVKTGSGSRGSGLGLDQDDEDESIIEGGEPLEEGRSEGKTSRRKISSEFSPYAVSQHMSMHAWSSNLKELFGDTSRKGSASNLQPLGETSAWPSQQCLLPERLYPKQACRKPNVPVALEISMTTCSKCHNCSSVLYDEEIMAGWVPEDSNLNTKCQFCDKATVPFLNVSVLDFRLAPAVQPSTPNAPTSAGSRESLLSSTGRLHPSSPLGISSSSVNSMAGVGADDEPAPVVSLDPITVPYLNPLVLRKELESILSTEGDSCLTHSKFVDEHPIIYWNMVWVFERICVSSHLTGLCLESAIVLNGREPSSFHPSWTAAAAGNPIDHSNVVIRTLWDNSRLHEEVGQPMYVLWNQDDQQSSLVSALVTDRTTVARSVMETVIGLVRCNNMVEPIRRLATERQKLKGNGVNRSHSLYRDILFLTFTVVGRDNIDQSAFDREYAAAYERLPERDSQKMYLRSDQPLSMASLYCRSYFRELEL